MGPLSVSARQAGWSLSFLLSLAGCGGGDPSPVTSAPAAAPASTSASAAATMVARFGLVAAQPAAAHSTASSTAPRGTSISGRLDEDSQKEALSGSVYFAYDAYVVTALESGMARVTSSVAESRFAYGYAFPISMGLIANGNELQAYGGNYERNASDTGVAVTNYTVDKDKQYILVYKTFNAFTPLRYTLEIGPALRLEGRIVKEAQVTADELPVDTGGLITLENTRPRTLARLMQEVTPVVQQTR